MEPEGDLAGAMHMPARKQPRRVEMQSKTFLICKTIFWVSHKLWRKYTHIFFEANSIIEDNPQPLIENSAAERKTLFIY